MLQKCVVLIVILLQPFLAFGQLLVTVSPVKATGQKAVVPLSMKNTFPEKVESARAVVFLQDEKGKVVGQGARWVIGEGANKGGLAAGATTAFHFVIGTAKPFSSTNLTAKVSFSRVVLEGGKIANAAKAANVTSAPK